MFEPTSVTATDPAVLLFAGRGVQGGPGDEQESSVLVTNVGADTVWLGGDGTVTDADGTPLRAGASVPFGDLGTDDELWGFASAPTEVRLLGLL